MRSQDEIESSIRLCSIHPWVWEGAHKARIDLPTGFTGSVIWCADEDGWEHVSVSHSNRRKLPTWDDMCRVKEIFWDAEETVVQIHPKESEYVHSVGFGMEKRENVLHLWRPAGGDWSRMEG